MVSRDELRRMAARRKLNLGLLEKEYVLDLVLRSLSAHEELRQVLVLKGGTASVSYTHLRAHETVLDLVCRLLLEKKKNQIHISTLDYMLSHIYMSPRVKA